MGLFRWLARIFRGREAKLAGDGPAKPAFVPGENPGILVHRHSGFRFPERAGGFQIAGAQQYDPEGLDVSAGYNQADRPVVAVTVYVYPCPEGDPADVLQSHFEGCKGDVASVHPGVRLVREEPARIAPGGAAREGKRAVFEVPEHAATGLPASWSELDLFVHRGFFVKYRITCPRGVETEADPAIRQFLDLLEWP